MKYFITSITKVTEDADEDASDSQDCVGYFSDEASAIKAIEEGRLGGDYLVVEQLPEGLHPQPISSARWFKWDHDNDRWYESSAPDFAWSLGRWAIQ